MNRSDTTAQGVRGALLEVVELPTDTLVPYEQNSRTHSEQQVDQIVRSITEFGFTNPVLVDPDRGIIAGHGRWMAAQKMGLETTPTITLSHLTEAQRRAYVIADNRLALNAGWDVEKLSAELQTLLSSDAFDIELLGFEQSDLDTLAFELTDKEISEMAAGDDSEPETDERESKTADFQNFSVPLSVDEEQIVRRAVRIAKTKYSVKSSGSAIAKALQDWLKGISDGQA